MAGVDVPIALEVNELRIGFDRDLLLRIRKQAIDDAGHDAETCSEFRTVASARTWRCTSSLVALVRVVEEPGRCARRQVARNREA
jgi:hypothetical protein